MYRCHQRLGVCLAGLLALSSTPWAIADSGPDDPSAEPAKNGEEKTRLRLRIGDDRVDEVSAKFEYRIKKGLARVKGTLKLWIPNTTTGVTADNAADALATATFSRGGAAYAECEFGYDRIIDGRIAEYVFAARQTGKTSSPRLRLQKGSCDVDLQADGLQAGIPGAQQGDLIEVEFHDESGGGGHIPLGEGNLR